MVAEFSAERYFLTGDSRQNPIVREVREVWLNEHEVCQSGNERRLVFVERYLGDRVEAWVSVVEFDGETERETRRYNAKHMYSIEFDEPMPEGRL